jgi:hypothetical protein
MGSRFDLTALLTFCVLSAFFAGCVSFQVIQKVEGQDVVACGDKLQPGKSTVEVVLSLLGAPDRLVELTGKDLFVYQRGLLQNDRVSLGFPVGDFWGSSSSLSAYGGLARYDTLALFFTSQGILESVVFQRGSRHPYLRTLLSRGDEALSKPTAVKRP